MLQKAAAVFLLIVFAGTATAQSWVQVESQPGTRQAIARAEAYARILPNVSAFRTGPRWHAIVLGPFATEGEARRRLQELRAQRLVPNDSYVADGSTFGTRVFSSEGTTTALAPTPVPAAPAPVLEPGEETEAEARRSERNLTREDRALIQMALKFEGFYASVIDAAFGPGTRRAMAEWQEAAGFEPTGVLTTLQRRDLVDGYNAVISSLSIAPVVDEQAGIEIELPTAMVKFDRYDAPFAHYEPNSPDNVKVVLISLEGGTTTLAAFYDIMQTLEAVPTDGERSLGRESFTIEGISDTIRSHTYARRAGDAVKGFSLIWPAGDDKRFNLALEAMRASFRTTDAILPDNAGTGVQDIDLLSGLEIRRPILGQSGFFIDGEGAVLTSSTALGQCQRITLDEETEVDLVAEEPGLGIALLRPKEPLSPLSVARLMTTEPRIQSDIAVSGFSFGGLLSAPTLTFGKLADLKSLDGDDRVARLNLRREPGDTGGPVFDPSGAVIGMLLAGTEGARQLPDEVSFAADAKELAAFLTENGVTPSAMDRGEHIPPEDLTELAGDLTVLVSCWN
ncbi:MAG: trypsin-like peptidase domain-containing protein [Paracoccaceae bacterium]|nr:trypsin-like peptidase domain-containing protein [Paracoccaceae bacterium]